ncbi:TetR/AcrR family transcriptional regulator SczA [Streptococcus pneumoniae]|nr:TetR/AcrR family transcriptional regulator SczA [Streptococcus pneumoniae]MDG8302535.1 TetR/AcrR family transcriptional regulator SczA [Streptococcus pneumoniae]MDG8309989.1 TetR/AcrR family transcriptional regulator SczA [Streptococcus pneumoniae]
MTNIDRRISKTKKAIYQAFIQLLNAKGYEATTVQDIIDLADVGRSTFYCHYESKELLLDQLCRYLFHHLFEREQAISTEDYLAHLFLHFHKNQDHITSLLFSKNDYFLRQLHKELEHHVYSVLADNLKEAHPNLPTSYLQYLVVSNFIETLTWWLKKGQDFTDQEVVQFYLDLLIPKN